jgi:hypothetical protein
MAPFCFGALRMLIIRWTFPCSSKDGSLMSSALSIPCRGRNPEDSLGDHP